MLSQEERTAVNSSAWKPAHCACNNGRLDELTNSVRRLELELDRLVTKINTSITVAGCCFGIVVTLVTGFWTFQNQSNKDHKEHLRTISDYRLQNQRNFNESP